MIEKLIVITGTDDDAGAVLDHKGELIVEIDQHNNDDVDIDLLRKLGHKVFEIIHEEIITEDEYEASEYINVMANKDLVIERVKKMILEGKIEYK